MNSLYQMFNQNNGMNQMIIDFQNFKKQFNGDPHQIVMNMLKSGQITQQQLNQAQAMANQLQGILK